MSKPRPDDCAAEDWLAFLGHRWNALLLWHLSDGPRRFSELEQLLPGISPKVLTERLAGLTSRGIALRKTTSTFPRAAIYQLSEDGRRLREILNQLYRWAEQHGDINPDRAAARGA